MELHALFIGNVAAHLIALMSGLASVAIATWEKIKKRPISSGIFLAIGCLCLLFASDQAWQDEHRNDQTLIAEKSSEISAKNSCLQDARVEEAYKRDLEGEVGSQRQTIDSERNMNAKQQADVNTCVVSLGKLNPKIREVVTVIAIPLYTFDPDTRRLVGQYSAHKLYASELLITTNEVKSRFHGKLRCDNSFIPLGGPQLPRSSQTIFSTNAEPSRISDREYEISATNSGVEWSPSFPAYLRVSTDTESPGNCTFTPQ